MTSKDKHELQRRFYRRVGENMRTIRQLFDTLPDTKFYIIDDQDRIITFNRQNLENGNFKSEMDVVGKTCAEVFPEVFAKIYMERDREVRRTGKPIIGRPYSFAADYSTDIRLFSTFPLRDGRGRIAGTVTAYSTSPTGGPLPDVYERIKGVMTYVESHYAEKLTAPRLAAIAGLSTSRFVRTFEKTLQTTPSRYITEIRLNAARKLLRNTNRKMADIATSTGFYDEAHFVKTFKRSRGVTPGEYRQRNFDTA